MSTMLELYRHRFGAGVKARGNGWNGPCPICGGEVGKSDRFMIWPDRERDLGYTCTENHIPGVFSCRRCGRIVPRQEKVKRGQIMLPGLA